MADPVTTGPITWSGMLSACVGAGKAGLSLPPVKEWLGGCKNRFVAGWWLPGNHELVRTLRTAHLAALDRVRRQHSARIEGDRDRTTTDDASINANLEAFLDQRLKALSEVSVDIGVVREADVAHALDRLLQPLPRASLTKEAEAARTAAEARALEEIETDAGRKAPPLFRRVFAGDGAPGWHDAFALKVADELKGNERFRAILGFAQEQETQRLVEALGEHVEDVTKAFPALQSGLEQGFSKTAADLARIAKTQRTDSRRLKGVKADTEKLIEIAKRKTEVGPPPAKLALPWSDLTDAGDEHGPNIFARLNWSYRLTEQLFGRDAEIERLLAYARGGGMAPSARLVSGLGGSGKTRLAAHAADVLRAEG
jgi:hypothetical protein